MRALLDVNVLIATLDARHVHHHAARSWIEQHVESGWASCPITENGFLRVMSQPGYPNPVPVAVAAERLAEAKSTRWHAFWPDAVSLLRPKSIDWAYVHGPLQLTDVHLLALAVEQGGRLVTFDRRINLKAVPKATADNLVKL